MSRPITEVLSVERVKAAYESTGLKPARGMWGNWDVGCACAAGAALCALTDRATARQVWIGEEEDEFMSVADFLDLDKDDVLWFTRGFDGDAVPGQLGLSESVAYEHGKAVAAAVFGGEP